MSVRLCGAVLGILGLSPERARDSQERSAAVAASDESACKCYACAPGTEAYFQCRMMKDQQRQANNAALAGAILSRPQPVAQTYYDPSKYMVSPSPPVDVNRGIADDQREPLLSSPPLATTEIDLYVLTLICLLVRSNENLEQPKSIRPVSSGAKCKNEPVAPISERSRRLARLCAPIPHIAEAGEAEHHYRPSGGFGDRHGQARDVRVGVCILKVRPTCNVVGDKVNEPIGLVGRANNVCEWLVDCCRQR